MLMTNQFFPFHALGFRCNPFRALTDEEWVETAVVPPQVQQTLNKGYTNLQILGEKGYGKTTLLLYLAAEKRRSSRRVCYEHIPEDGRTFQTSLQNLDYFCLDEAQRLTKKERKRLLNHTPSPGLIVASHENLAPLFAENKRPLTTIQLQDTGPDHLKAVLNKRLNYFSLENATPAPLSQQTINQLWQKFGRNIRAAEHHLYEYYQGLLYL